ncbi:cathepsin A (carboxypeptidase C) [Schistosoma bovis]|uniref:Cathepsin A (Carboxypeptidase C) n=1 Tax=Schistosoma bovis TaxID=6184 RepID=A0A430QGP9_SCHBO|nr:cathepsin A (carboxypeptidase C) [Schistosoma bovis]
MSVVILALIVLSSFSLASSSRNRPGDLDEILYLPGAWPQPNFKQFSGYLHGSSDKVNIHYWLVEAASSPASAPLIVWLNGGPGCSSLEGLLTENGPYLIANVLYLEAPAGVGFSYSTAPSQTWDDDQSVKQQDSQYRSFNCKEFDSCKTGMKEAHLSSLIRHNLTTRLVVPCVDDTVIRSYLNSPIVRRFINVRLDLPKEWDLCSETVNLNYVRIYHDLTEQYMKLLKSKIVILIYNGDIDMVCNYIGDEWFVDNLNLTADTSDALIDVSYIPVHQLSS